MAHDGREVPSNHAAPEEIIALSAETGRGLDKLMPAVLKTHADWSTKVKTRDLNDWLAMAVPKTWMIVRLPSRAGAMPRA